MSPGDCVRCTAGPAWYLCNCPADCGQLHCARRGQAQRDFMTARARARAATIQRMAAQGHTASWIIAATGLSQRTVYRYMKEASAK